MEATAHVHTPEGSLADLGIDDASAHTFLEALEDFDGDATRLGAAFRLNADQVDALIGSIVSGRHVLSAEAGTVEDERVCLQAHWKEGYEIDSDHGAFFQWWYDISLEAGGSSSACNDGTVILHFKNALEYSGYNVSDTKDVFFRIIGRNEEGKNFYVSRPVRTRVRLHETISWVRGYGISSLAANWSKITRQIHLLYR